MQENQALILNRKVLGKKADSLQSELLAKTSQQEDLTTQLSQTSKRLDQELERATANFTASLQAEREQHATEMQDLKDQLEDFSNEYS
jgi:gas vesicle protein